MTSVKENDFILYLKVFTSILVFYVTVLKFQLLSRYLEGATPKPTNINVIVLAQQLYFIGYFKKLNILALTFHILRQ